MKIKKKKAEGTTLTIEAVASTSDVERAFEAAHVAFAQRMSLKPDGNKTIAQIAYEHYGIENLDSTVAPQIVDYLIPFAVDLAGVIPAYPAKELSSIPARRDAELVFSVELALKADLQLSSYEPVHITVPAFVLVEEQVDKQIEEMALAYAEFKPIEPRPAQRGDSCLLTIRAQENYTDIQNLSAEKAIYNLGSALISPEFDEQIVGMNAGENRDFSLEIALGSHEGFITRTVDFMVELIEVREHDIPIIDDAWIKENASGVESLKAFKDLLRAEFNKSYKKDYDELVRQEAISELAKRYTGAISDEAMLAMQQTIINNLQKKLEQEDKDLDTYIEEQGGQEQFNVATMMQSRDALAQGYALDALFLHEKMSISNEDILEACKSFDANNPDMIKKQMEYSGCAYMLREQAERQKASNWLVVHAEIETTAAA